MSVPASRSDARLLLTATAAVVTAGVIVAVVLLFASGRSHSPTKYEPFSAGPAKAIKQQLREGGPYYVPDPFGGNKSILFALENGEIVALSNIVPGTKNCAIRWRGLREPIPGLQRRPLHQRATRSLRGDRRRRRLGQRPALRRPPDEAPGTQPMSYGAP